MTTVLLLSALLAQVPGPTDAEVFADRGETYVRLGFNHGLTKGLTLEVAAAATHQKVGNLVVMEVWDGLSRVSLDSTAAAFKGPKVARQPGVTGAPPSPPPPPAPVVAAAPLGPVVSGEPPPVPAVPGPAPRPGAVPVAGRQLTGKVTANGPISEARRIIVYNHDAFDWQGCTLRLPDGRVYSLGTLRSHEDDGIMLFRFEPDGAMREPGATGVLVRCQEGGAVFQISM